MATLSEHASDGHWTRGHMMLRVVMSQVHTAHVSKPLGGKYGCHELPARWNWSPRWQPRAAPPGAVVMLASSVAVMVAEPGRGLTTCD